METQSKTVPVTQDHALAHITKAVAALPMPFAIYDTDDRLLLCSQDVQDLIAPLLPEGDMDLLSTPVYFEDVQRLFYHERLPADQADHKLLATMRAHEQRQSQVRDINEGGHWKRRSRTVAPGGQIVALTVPIHELVEKSEALSKAKEQLEHMAFHDPLTGLPNRRGLSEHLAELSKMSEKEAYNVSVLHVDLDKFKLVNDTLGHDAGDVVLSEAAKRLKEQVRTIDIVARVGGDEFVILCHDAGDEEATAIIAQRIVDSMAVPIPYREDLCQIGASIGIAITSAHNISEHVLMDADIALYEAKNKGRGRYEFFYPVFRHRYSTLQKRINEVRDAITLNAFEPFFQPQICARTGDFIGLEALARWSDREKGILAPGAFMTALNEAHLTEELDRMILIKTLKFINKWKDEDGIDVPCVKLNLSEGRLRQPDLVDQVKWAMDDADLGNDRIGFEILETVVVGDGSDIVVENIRRLSQAGFKVALDDFGTGNASIANLRKLAIDTIKIDMSFVTDVDTDAELRLITGAMISLANSLKLDTVCEGVETAAQAKVLEELGTSAYQGYLFAKPMDGNFIPTWIQGYEEDRIDWAQSA